MDQFKTLKPKTAICLYPTGQKVFHAVAFSAPGQIRQYEMVDNRNDALCEVLNSLRAGNEAAEL